MQDRLKFRVWDKKQKRYINFEQFKKGDIEFNFNPQTNEIWIEYDKSRYVVEQCTGLKDKNGKSIFDCDIVRVINQDTQNRPDLQIGYIWTDELYCTWIKFSNEELSWNDFCSLVEYDLTLSIEVIGNIHENPELLEKKDE